MPSCATVKFLGCAVATLIVVATALPARAADPATQPVGLDSLGDQALMDELAARGLDDLLNRVFAQDKVPAAQQNVIRTIGSLNRLASDTGLSPADRQITLKKIVTQIGAILPTLADNPDLMIRTGRVLAEEGVDPEVGILEYWGPTDAEKARLRPMAEAAWRLYKTASESATRQATDIANRITSPDDKLGDAWRRMTDMAGAAAYQAARMRYAMALSLDVADLARRPDIIDEAMQAFAHWDNADSGIQPQVRLMMAKLQVLRETPSGTAQARNLLNSLIHNPDGAISPAPSEAMKYEALCYAVVAELSAGNLDAAVKALSAATNEQQAHFADDPSQLVPLRLLNYRVLAMRADHAPAGPERDAANAQAVQSLLRILKDFPGLRDAIYRQFAARLPPKPDMATLDPLLLSAIMEQGLQELLNHSDTSRPADAIHPADEALVRNGLAAAQELMNRNKAGTFPDDQAAQPSLLIGVFQEFLGDKIAAADSFLDHAMRFGNVSSARADFALDRARDLIGQLRSTATDATVERLEGRFLPIAIHAPFNHTEFALQYAAILLKQGQWAAAIPFYRMVSDETDPSRLLSARYGELVCLKNLLESNPTLSAEERQAMTARVQSLMQSVNTLAGDLAGGSSSPALKTQARSTQARMALLAADITRKERNDPQAVLRLLTGFEDSVHDLPDARSLLDAALFLRVQAYMQLGQNDDATATLVEYLNSTGGAEGAQTVHDLLQTLNGELDKATAQADAARSAGNDAASQAAQGDIRKLADNRAMLSGFLATWAQNNPDPKIRAFRYTYRRFDADAQRLAAALRTDPDERKKALQAAMDRYRQLLTPENVALYQASLDPAAGVDPNYPDPLVTLGIGLTAYDLGDWKTAKDSLGRLIHDGKLGENNDSYWEATYKLLDAMARLAQAGDPGTRTPDVQQSLKVLYLIWRDGTGGPKWHNQFEALRKRILPDWNPPPSAPTTP